MISKLQVSVDRVSKIEKALKSKKLKLQQAEITLQEAVGGGGQNDALALRVVSLQAEVKAIERSLVQASKELEVVKSFQNSQEAEDLRERLKKLKLDHDKIYKGVVSKVKPLMATIDDLVEKLVEYDQVNRALGAMPNQAFGYISLKRKAPYSGVIRLKTDLERFSKFIERYD